MNGRYFGGRRIKCQICTEKIRFAKSTKSTQDVFDEETRLEKYAEWLEKHE